MGGKDKPLPTLEAVVTQLRKTLNDTDKINYIFIYAYNGTGKTRLSMAFKDAGKQGEDRDTLYFNAYTEDLFTWDNDLNGDSVRVLRLNQSAKFFAGLEQLAMEERIRGFLHRYVDFDFAINYKEWTISFSREVEVKTDQGIGHETIDNIKISRGEENTFIWCFFLAIAELALSGDEAYSWVKYIYIDDPISSLDDNNAIAIASNLGYLIKSSKSPVKVIVSSHHTLFFNIVSNELSKRSRKYFLSRELQSKHYMLKGTSDTPFFHHVAALVELHNAAQSDALYTYHFTMLRTLLEKTASFHGFEHFSSCIPQTEDYDEIMYSRLLNILSHGNYSLYEPREMLKENKELFKKILSDFMQRYPFNQQLFEHKEGKEA